MFNLLDYPAGIVTVGRVDQVPHYFYSTQHR